MIGPWTVKTQFKSHKLLALTMIDPVSHWFEIVAVPDKEAKTIQNAFDNAWLSRYPRPTYVRCDNGTEFKNLFKRMCTNFGITLKPTTSYNPSATGIIERVHQTIGNMLRTHELEKRELDPKDPWGIFLSSVAWAVRSTYHTTIDATPGQLVFGRDMILPIHVRTDWAMIKQRRQNLIKKNNEREN